MQVIKRDGRIVQYDEAKVRRALESAFKAVDNTLTAEDKEKVAQITNYISEFTQPSITVEEIQDFIEHKLMSSNRKDVAKHFIIYRNNRTIEREKKSTIVRKIARRINATNVENSNANVDERSFSGREKEASGDVFKTMALDYGGLSKKVANAHKEMLVYSHDLDKSILGQHNCLFADLGKLFKTGFKTRNGDVRPPTRFSTACQQVAVIFQCQSQVQFGGVASSHLDYDLAPFVKMSFYKHFKDGLKYIEEEETDEQE